MRLTGLANHLRRWGFDVVEVGGWETRGKPFEAKPVVVVCHHTGSRKSATKDYPSLAVVRDGRSDLPGPLSQLGLGYSGKVYVIASGKANHAGKGSWRGIDVGNSRSVGIEAESPGDGTWTAKQREVYPKLAAAVAAFLGVPAGNICAHRESALPAGRKPDPEGIAMNALRRDAAGWIQRDGKPVTPPVTLPPEEARMIVKFESTGTFYEVVGSHLEALTSQAYNARGKPKVTVIRDDHPLSKLPRTDGKS
jgi:hypothetical protein